MRQRAGGPEYSPLAGRSCTVIRVLPSILRLLSVLLLAGALATLPAPAWADDDDDDRSGRQERESRNDDRGEREDRTERRTFIEIERDDRGGDRQRDEVLVIGPLDAAEAIRNAGFRVLSERRLDTLQRSLLRVRVRNRETIDETIAALRQQVPGVRAAPNHVFEPSGAAPGAPVLALPGAATPATGTPRIGIIDTGADATHPRLRDVVVATRGFSDGGYVARPHGTAVAQLATSLGASVAVADVFGLDRRRRLVAPAESIAAAIDWQLSMPLRVINISIEGPRNEVLEFVVAEAVARGTAIVAAVGNSGPAAPPAYPAAFPDVIAVTALDDKGTIYRRAARGSHVQFAARGSFAGKAAPVLSKERLAGTSFAAPLVSAELERRWRQNPGASRQQIVSGMRTDAVDLGAPGRDPVYGWGGVDPFRSGTAAH